MHKFSFHLNRFFRAHFLAAETADTLFIIVHWRISFSIFKVYRFTLNRAALYTYPAGNTSAFHNIRFLLKNTKRSCKLCPFISSYRCSVHLKIRFSVCFRRLGAGHFSVWRQNPDIFSPVCTKSHFFSMIICRNKGRLKGNKMAEYAVKSYRVSGQ